MRKDKPATVPATNLESLKHLFLVCNTQGHLILPTLSQIMKELGMPRPKLIAGAQFLCLLAALGLADAERQHTTGTLPVTTMA